MKITDYIKGKVKYDAYGGQYFWDSKNHMIAELRGWGRIQNLFKDKKGQIDADKAAAFQDKVGEWVAEAINEKLESQLKPQEGEWISVKDRLPKESGRYWCYISEQNDLGLSFYQWNCAYNKEENRWSSGLLAINTTHWQSLPTPPKG